MMSYESYIKDCSSEQLLEIVKELEEKILVCKELIKESDHDQSKK